ncbi:TonB-dependent receptor [Alkalimonas sp. MEB108]|uniref:TonB-dependent receptor n=1 Tax=Alkalimonas cellulosilytica TaxID=3058395 RepID=A0ABU7J5R2_9GAMM|nr:TonB-dependent receptor [Alkalimonas sp. MEB108]MEE2001668.1 TonB-dependent receptor [Alkalimonas sp. MEB108]
MPAVAVAELNDEEAQEQKPERIQVVGSRIRTDGFDNATPIEIISSEVVADSGLNNLGELLRTSTIASGSNQLTSALTVGYVTAGGSGNESVSMRGLGSNRTLVLLNGRRAGPAGTRGQVAAFDMNTLPVSVVERVEILKDGASSLYGSDAVAGVINIITKRGDDSSINVNFNQPFNSGGERFNLNATLGRTFDRGSYRLMADYRLDSELKRGDRSFFACSERLLFDPVTGERGDPIDPRTGNYHCADAQYGVWMWATGASNVPAGVKAQYDYDGFFAQFNRPTFADLITDPDANNFSAPAGWYPVSYDRESDGWGDQAHPFNQKRSMIPETEVWSIYGQVDYELTDNMGMYAEFLHNRRNTQQQSVRQFWYADFPQIPGGRVDGWEGGAVMMPVNITDHFGTETDVHYTRAVLGLEGSIGDWDWDLSYQNSYNWGRYTNDIIFRDSMLMGQRTQQADADGNLRTCAIGERTQFSDKACINMNWLDADLINGNPSQSVRNFLFGEDVGHTVYKQQTVEGYITGDLFELPAGMVGTAVGASFQTDEIEDTPGFHTRNGNSWGLTGAGITAGKSNTRAVFAELNIPVLHDKPFVESLDVTASGRWTDVSTYGSDTTYKLSAHWEVAGGLSVRASKGTSFRSPALFELYLDAQTGFLGQTVDPCLDWANRLEAGTIAQRVADNCATVVPATYTTPGSSITSVTSGGLGRLGAETSVNKNLGIVWKNASDSFIGSIDYYKYDIKGQISNVGGANVLNTCYNSENFPNEPLCNQIVRRNGGQNGLDFGVETVFGGYTNVANQIARGVDVGFNYTNDFSFGTLRVNYQHNIQLKRSFQLFSTSTPSQYVGDVGDPKHSSVLRVTLIRDDLRLNWTTNYFGKTDDYKYFANGNLTTYRGAQYEFIADTPTTIYHTASASRIFGDFDVTVGVRNLFDKEPPQVSLASGLLRTGNAPLYSQYDLLGRRVFANITYNF